MFKRIRLFAEEFAFDTVESFGGLLVHFFGEAKITDANDIVAADLGSIGLELFICKVHLAERLKDAVEVNFALAHSRMLMNRVIRFAASIEPRRIDDIAAINCLIPRVSLKDMRQFVASIAEHMPNVAFALVVEETVTCRVNVAEVL